jgi:hypothetical protein
MDFRTYDTAFVDKLGSAMIGGKRHLVVTGIEAPVGLLFDRPSEWWQEYTLPGVNVRRVDLVPDPSRFLPGFLPYEMSTNPDTPNTFNRAVAPPQPITILYEVEMAASSQQDMNALLVHTTLRLPTRGYGTTINAFGHSMPFRANSIRNLSWNQSENKKDGRKFAWSYTYAVEAWITSTECVKVPQILQIDLTIEAAGGYVNTITVESSTGLDE